MSKFDGMKNAPRGAAVVGAAPAPVGKRGDPSYKAVMIYMKRANHDAAKIALIKDGCKQDFSELIDGLLASWLKSHKAG